MASTMRARIGSDGKRGKGMTTKDMKAATSAANSASAAKWELNNEAAAKLSSAAMTDDELMAAKNAFFQTDKDGSGAIDREEIAVMMKSLGQAPTKKMIDDIINSADGNHKLDADSNGKIELREFLNWYGLKLKSKRDTSTEDVADVYRALGGELADAADAGDAAASLLGEKKAVTKEEFAAALKEQYDLDIDVDELFAKHVGMELKMADLEELIFRDPPTG